MDYCEGSHPTLQSEIVHAKPTAMADGKYEPAGEGLPDGWLKEYRPRKTRGSRIKGDMFYIDPINGYEFRSLKGVYRYLESGDLSQCVMLPNKRKNKDLHTAGDQSDNTGKQSDHTQSDTAVESNQYDIPRGINTPRNVQREAVRVEASESKSRSGSVDTTGKAESVIRTGANVDQKPKEKKHKSKLVKGIATPLRSSPRLAALKISQEAKNNAPADEPISTHSDITNESQPKQVHKPSRKVNSSVLPERKDGAPTSSSSEKHPLVTNQVQGASVPYSSGDAGWQNAPAEAPVLPQQGDQGETSDNMPGSAMSSLFRHVWSDPCLVFAFRTLMGDIPVLNDTLAYRSSAYDGNRNYFLPPQNLNKGTAPNWSSSAYDGNRNHTQVDRVGLSVPSPSDKFYGSGWFPPQ